MTNFDDEMRRMFADRRIGQVPNPPSVADLVQGASRRRTRRVVVSAVSAVGVVAALAVGATALVDFTNTAGPDLAPAVTPTDTAQPTNEPTTTPSDEPTAPQTDEPTETPSDPTNDPSGPPEEGDQRPVLDPAEGFAGVQIGMTMAELEDVEGVTVTEYSSVGRTEYCYGYYESDQVSGLISVRAPLGEAPDPADSIDDFVVTTLTVEGPVQTPEGVGWGSTWEDVRDAYPGLEEGPSFDSFAFLNDDQALRWVFDDHTAGEDPIKVVTLDGGQTCAG